MCRSETIDFPAVSMAVSTGAVPTAPPATTTVTTVTPMQAEVKNSNDPLREMVFALCQRLDRLPTPPRRLPSPPGPRNEENFRGGEYASPPYTSTAVYR